MAAQGPGPIPPWGWMVFGAVAAAALVSLLAALWLRLPEPVRRQASTTPLVAPNTILPLDLPYLPMPVSPTETPPANEPAPPVELPPLTPVVGPVVGPGPADAVTPTALYPQGAGRLALVIDDMGMEPTLSARAIQSLPAPVTLAFMVEAPATHALAVQAKSKGHSLIVHIPMEPQPHAEGTPALGPLGLQVGMSSATIVAQVRANLAPLAGLAEGANNHMGSRFTQWEAGMRDVLAEVAAQGFYFLDSRTAAPTATRAAAKGLGLGLAARDVFLDHAPTEAAVRAQLQYAVRLAQKRGVGGIPVVVIGHPLPATLAVLERDLPLLQQAGITLVPLRTAVRDE